MKSPWTTFALAIVILFIVLVTGKFNGTTLLALLVLVILGGIFPPFAVPFAAVILVYLLLVHGPDAVKKVTPTPGSAPTSGARPGQPS